MQNFRHHARRAAATCRHRIPASTNLDTALAFGTAEIPVFPCGSAGARVKQPMTVHGHHDATTDRDKIQQYWMRRPDALVGIPTGPPSGIWVLDVDGEAGRSSLNELLATLGLESIAELTRCVSRTPNGGLHLIFALQPGERPRNRTRDIGAGLDTRGVREDGGSAGYFIAPGSVLPDGRKYELIDPTTLEPTGGAA